MLTFSTFQDGFNFASKCYSHRSKDIPYESNVTSYLYQSKLMIFFPSGWFILQIKASQVRISKLKCMHVVVWLLFFVVVFVAFLLFD